MASIMAESLRDPHPAALRRKALVVPREHGAWGMLLIPLATGAAVARAESGGFGDLAWFVLASIALFWMRTPLESWLGTSLVRCHSQEERRFALKFVTLSAVISGVCLGRLLWTGSILLIAIGGAAGLAVGLQFLLRRMGRRFRIAAQVAGALGLTSTAAAAYYVVSGRLDRMGIALWLASWLFAAGQIHYVQLRVRHSRLRTFPERLQRGGGFFTGQLVLFAVVLFAAEFGWLPRLAALTFVPALLRGIWWFAASPRPLVLVRLGFSELAHSVTFGLLLTVAFVRW